VFENRVLRKKFGPMRDEVIWGWRKLHSKDLYDPYYSPNTISVMKSGNGRWVGHGARI